MPGSVSPARGLRRHGPSRASDINERGVHADTVSPGYRRPSYLPPERRTPVRFGLESPSRYLFLLSRIWVTSGEPSLHFAVGPDTRKGCHYISVSPTYLD